MTVMEMLTADLPFKHIGNAYKVMNYVAQHDDGEPVFLPDDLVSDPDALDFIRECLQRVRTSVPFFVVHLCRFLEHSCLVFSLQLS